MGARSDSKRGKGGVRVGVECPNDCRGVAHGAVTTGERRIEKRREEEKVSGHGQVEARQCAGRLLDGDGVEALVEAVHRDVQVRPGLGQRASVAAVTLREVTRVSRRTTKRHGVGGGQLRADVVCKVALHVCWIANVREAIQAVHVQVLIARDRVHRDENVVACGDQTDVKVLKLGTIDEASIAGVYRVKAFRTTLEGNRR